MNEILNREFELLVVDLIAKHQELGMESSGRWIQSLEIIIENNKALLLANPYTYQLVHGRSPGAFPPIKSIEEWIYEKPITLEEGMKVSTLAFLIARKIANEGTKYFQDGGTDLIESVVTPQRIQRIIDKVAEFQIVHFVNEVTDVFKQFAA